MSVPAPDRSSGASALERFDHRYREVAELDDGVAENIRRIRRERTEAEARPPFLIRRFRQQTVRKPSDRTLPIGVAGSCNYHC